MKTEDSDVSQRTGLPAFVFCPGGVCSVFYHANSSRTRKFIQSVHIAALSIEMNRKDGLGARGYLLFNQSRIEVERARVDIGEYHACSQHGCRICGGNPADRRRDDLVPRSNA